MRKRYAKVVSGKMSAFYTIIYIHQTPVREGSVTVLVNPLILL